MTVLSLANLLKTTNDPLEAGVIENLITTDYLLSSLPWEDIGPRDSTTVVREKALPVTTRAASGATITASATGDKSRVPTYIRRYINDQEPDQLDAGAAGGFVSVQASCIGDGVKSIAQMVGDDLINGYSNFTCTVNEYGTCGITGATITVGPGHDLARGTRGSFKFTFVGLLIAYKAPQDRDYGTAVAYTSGVRVASSSEGLWATFTESAGALGANGDVNFTLSGGDLDIDGLFQLCPQDANNPQWIDSTGAAGDSLSLTALDLLAKRVKDNKGPKIYVMHSTLTLKLIALLRSASFSSMDMYTTSYFPTLSTGNVSLLKYNGIPVLETDYMPTTMVKGGSGATLSAVFCATLGPRAGLSGIFSTAAYDVEDAARVLFKGANGIMAVDLGTSQIADTRKVRVKGYLGLKNASSKGLAMLDNIKLT